MHFNDPVLIIKGASLIVFRGSPFSILRQTYKTMLPPALAPLMYANPLYFAQDHMQYIQDTFPETKQSLCQSGKPTYSDFVFKLVA